MSDGEGAVVKRHVTDLMKAGEIQVENADDFADACGDVSSEYKNAFDIHNLHYTANKPIRTVLQCQE